MSKKIPNSIKSIGRGLKHYGVLAAVLIMLFSYSSFFYFQQQTQQEVKSQIFNEQMEKQVESTSKAADHIDSDLTLMLSHLDVLSNSRYLQEGQFYDQDVRKLAEEKFGEMSGIADRLFILNSDDVVVAAIGNPSSATAPLGNDLSFRTWVKETRETARPVFSEGFENLGEYRIFITNPIVDRTTGNYLGLVGVSIPTVRFFEHYGNVHDINSQFLVVFDKEGTLLAVGAGQSLVGENFFGEEVQDFVNENPTLNRVTAELLQGKAGSAIYDYGQGERLTTYQPIYLSGRTTYFLEVVTPTATLYPQIDEILSRENTRMALLLLGTTVATIVLILTLLSWNSSLKKEVQKRTKEIQESNKLLETTNQQLTESQRVQKEFINVAAHEIRTPIQPILGLSKLVREKTLNLMNELNNNQVQSGRLQAADLSIRPDPHNLSSLSEIETMTGVIDRNAIRLEKLINNLLDFSRIENNSLKLAKEYFSLDDLIDECLVDMKQYTGSKNTVFSRTPTEGNRQIMLHADRSRITQVLINLLDNAVKYSKGETVNVRTDLYPEENVVVLSVTDRGSAIKPDMFSKLFIKFGTGSESGTGLGLYISKNIVEAHGGKIWAKNNKDGKGATFSFTLPVLAVTGLQKTSRGLSPESLYGRAGQSV